MELSVSAALVCDSAERAASVIHKLEARRPAWLPGYRVRVLDGNAPSATEHRLEALRDTWAAPLPGKVLVVMDPELGLACQVFLTPDGHAQEWTLLDDVLETVRAKDLWIADRNFWTRKFMFGIAAEPAFFLLRQHGKLRGALRGSRCHVGESSTGEVYEQSIELTPEGQTETWRRVTVELRKPTRDGDRVWHVLTNLPAEFPVLPEQEERNRWAIETLFYEVTQTLSCEIQTLCYPAAALFVFRMALMAANGVAVLKGALRAAHGDEEADALSAYYLALDIKQIQAGMMIAWPPDEWAIFRALTAAALRKMAEQMDLGMYRKSKRGPKKPRPSMDQYRNGGHVSTYKLLTAKDT